MAATNAHRIRLSPAARGAMRPARWTSRPGNGGGLIVCGLILVAVTSVPGALAVRASRWPAAPGVIVESWVETEHSSRHGTSRICRVSYGFTVRGERFSGSRLDAVPVWSGDLAPLRDRDRFPAGAPCTVRYNPANPDESCLRTGVHAGIAGLLVAGVALVAVGGVVALRERRSGISA